MDTVIAIASQLVQLGISLVPQIVDAVSTEMRLSGSPVPPTDDEMAVIDMGLLRAHEALQAAQQRPG